MYCYIIYVRYFICQKSTIHLLLFIFFLPIIRFLFWKKLFLTFVNFEYDAHNINKTCNNLDHVYLSFI